ncbi:MAG TPA: MbcA/ParS/Xre antitoxin family protein [Methylomirabilota bacterium]|nr:MbcA/ParS/Xre antitoxin family protein [Methylomirabilota bacterium]
MASLQQPVVGFSWPSAVDLSKKENRARLSASAMKGLFRIAVRWGLKDDETRALLGGISTGGFYAFKNQPARTLDEDRLTRISLLIGIYKALNILFGQKLADAWVSLPNTNPMFGGESPLQYMKKGGIPALLRVRQLLDARRGGR